MTADLYAFTFALGSDEINRLRTLPYTEYLRSDWWQWKRMHAIDRARGHCELCQQSGSLEAHHVTYDHLGCERNHELVVLCKPCHEHVTTNGLSHLSRHELLGRRSEIIHSPEFQRANAERLAY